MSPRLADLPFRKVSTHPWPRRVSPWRGEPWCPEHQIGYAYLFFAAVQQRVVSAHPAREADTPRVRMSAVVGMTSTPSKVTHAPTAARNPRCRSV